MTQRLKNVNVQPTCYIPVHNKTTMQLTVLVRMAIFTFRQCKAKLKLKVTTHTVWRVYVTQPSRQCRPGSVQPSCRV